MNISCNFFLLTVYYSVIGPLIGGVSLLSESARFQTSDLYSNLGLHRPCYMEMVCFLSEACTLTMTYVLLSCAGVSL